MAKKKHTGAATKASLSVGAPSRNCIFGKFLTRVLGRHGRPAQVRRHHLSTKTKNTTCPHSCGRSAAALACRAACTVSTHCRKRGRSRSHRVLGRHGRPAQVRRHHLSTETKNATCPHSCCRSAAALACRAACTVWTHCRERGRSRSHRILGRHGRPAQVRRHHLSTETKNATCPHSCGRSAAALAGRARYVCRFSFLFGCLRRPFFLPFRSWAALCRPRSGGGRR